MLISRTSAFTKLGSFLMLLAVAIDPFSQQLIQFRTEIRFAPWFNPPLAYNIKYESGDLNPSGKKAPIWGSKIEIIEYGADIDPPLEASILDGLFNNGSESKDRANMWCATPYCRWEKFITAGICYKCNSLTSQLTLYHNWSVYDSAAFGGSYNISAYFLPNGAYLQNLNSFIGVASEALSTDFLRGEVSPLQMMGYATSNRNETISMKNLTTLFWSMSAVHVDWAAIEHTLSLGYDWPKMPVLAQECALYYCGLEVSSNFTNNTLMETSHEIDLRRDPGSWQLLGTERFPDIPRNAMDSLAFDPSTGALSRTDLTLINSKNDTVVTFMQDAVFSISNYFQSTFQTTKNLTLQSIDGNKAPGTVTLRSPHFPVGKANLAFFGYQSVPRKVAGIWNGKQGILGDLEIQFKAVAEAMTIAIRNSGNNDQIITGAEVGQPMTVYTVQWAWIALHAFIIVGGTGFFIVTTLKTSEAKKLSGCLPWKTSSLATISKAAEFGPLFEPSDDIHVLEDKAKVKTATLSRENGEMQDLSRSNERVLSESLSD